MAYKPTASADFAFNFYAYQPAHDFYFQPEPVYPFLPPPKVVTSYGSQWQKAQSHKSSLGSSYGRSLTRQISIRQTSHQGRPVDAARLGLFWGKVAKQEVLFEISHGKPSPCQVNPVSQWKQPPAKESHLHESWDQSIQERDRQSREQWQQASTQDRQQTEAFDRVDEFGSPFQYQTTQYQPPSVTLLDFTFDGQRYTPASAPAVYFNFQQPDNSHAIQLKDRTSRQSYSSNSHQDEPIRIPWGLGRKAADEDYTTGYGGETEPLPPKQEPEQPEIREGYLFMNTISVVTLPERVAIEMRDMEISLDIDSFLLGFSR